MLDKLNEVLISKIGLEPFQTWFSNSKFEICDGALKLTVGKRSDLSWIKKNYRTHIEVVAKDCCKTDRVIFTIDEKPQTAPIKQDPAQGNDQKNAKNSPQIFISDNCNKIALSTINYLLENTASSVLHGKMLHIFGGCGVGKTAILKYTLSQLKTEDVIFFSALEFVNKYANSVRHNMVDSFRNEIFLKKFFVIDDIHLLASQKGSLQEFSRIVSIFTDSKKVVITSGNRQPSDLPTEIMKAVKQLQSCLSIGMENPSESLKTKFAEFLLHENDLSSIFSTKDALSNAKTMKDIDSVVAKLKLSNLTNTPVLFEDLAIFEPENTYQVYIDEVLKHFCIKKEKLFSRGGGKEVSMARYVIIYLLRKNTDLTMQRIASIFNLKSHTNIVRALNFMGNKDNENIKIMNIIAKIQNSVHNASESRNK